MVVNIRFFLIFQIYSIYFIAYFISYMFLYVNFIYLIILYVKISNKIKHETIKSSRAA